MTREYRKKEEERRKDEERVYIFFSQMAYRMSVA
jgi:hypothetical protein